MKQLIISTVNKDRIAKLLSSVIPVLIGIYIFFNPFPHTTAIKEITFYFSAGLFLILIFLRPDDYSLKSPLSVPFLLFSLWSFAGLFFALNMTNSIHDFFKHLLKYIAYYYIIINFFRTRKHLSIFLWLVVVSSVIFSLVNVIYFYGIADNSLTSRLSPSWYQVQTNLINITTVFASILAIFGFIGDSRLYPRIFFFFSFCVTILTSFTTQTRGAVIALLTAVILLFSIKKKVLLALFLLLSLLITLTPLKNRFRLDEFLHNERFGAHLVAWEIIKEHPVFGVGFGMNTFNNDAFLKPYYEKLPDEYRKVIINNPHNIFTDTAVRTGLVGFALFFYLIINTFRMLRSIMSSGNALFFRNWGRCLMAAFVAILIQGMFETPLSGPPAVTLYTILGMITILWRLQHDKMDKTDDPVADKIKTGL